MRSRIRILGRPEVVAKIRTLFFNHTIGLILSALIVTGAIVVNAALASASVAAAF